uniref:FHA domain-containing protein n=1 Tax=Timema monikensis TaxID=170555 RepID=A0A7R9EGX6_9NEOP|nr:unnamed protein product [Timema monikensis]
MGSKTRRYKTSLGYFPGRVTLGSSPLSDVVVQGTGVEPSHCYIENHHGVVVLHPVLGPTTLDGLLVSTPVRLTQGCMLCIGRSNYLRFNHPAEAQLMRTILPNTRISMMPLSLYNVEERSHFMRRECTSTIDIGAPRTTMLFYLIGLSAGDSADGRSQPLEKKPPVAPRKSPRDSWGEVSTSSGSEDCCLLGKPSRVQVPVARLLSPKVFPPGSATVNSPASAVLGPSGLKNVPTATNVPTYQNVLFTNGSAVRSRSATPTNTYVNLSPTHSVMIGPPGRSQSTTPTPFKSPNYRAPVGVSRSVTSSPAFGTSHCGNAGSTPSLNEGPIYQRSHSTPSPAFNRNPGGLRSVTPSPPKSGGVASLSVNHRRTLSAGHDLSRDVVSPTPSFGSNCSLEELAARKDELEHKRKQVNIISSRDKQWVQLYLLETVVDCLFQAQQERMREQEAEKQERARLEEIVAMCAEYERQNKPPSTPTIHQNRSSFCSGIRITLESRLSGMLARMKIARNGGSHNVTLISGTEIKTKRELTQSRLDLQNGISRIA